MKNSSTRAKTIAIPDLIEQAHDAELCRDLELSQSVLALYGAIFPRIPIFLVSRLQLARLFTDFADFFLVFTVIVKAE
jgi:hypothetical protein